MKKPLAVFDIDGTIFRSSLVIELTSALVRFGIFPQDAEKEIERHLVKWSNREGSYEEYINQVVKTFQKHIIGCYTKDIRRISKLVIREQKNKVYRYTRDLVSRLKKTHTLVAISGSPLEMVEEFSRQWGFGYAFGTIHTSFRGIYNGGMVVPAENKKKTLEKLVQDQGLSLARSVGVGDTEGDISFLRIVSRPLCFNPNKRLYRVAKKEKWPVAVERKDVIYHIQ